MNSFINNKILVTGGLGFIGHRVSHFLEARGYQVIIIDSMTNYGCIPDSELSSLYKFRKSTLTSPIYDIDICDKDAVKKIIESHNISTIIHLASYPRQKTVSLNPIGASQTMITGLMTLLEIAKETNVRKFTYVSSSMVYGDFTEGVTESAPTNPVCLYGILKLCGEEMVHKYQNFFNTVILRPSAVYGPADVSGRVISQFFENSFKNSMLEVNGSAEILDFTYVDDTAMGIVLASTIDNANNKIYNLSRGRGRSLIDAAFTIIKLVGSGYIKVSQRNNDFPSRNSLDISRAHNDFGFWPTVDIEEGFQKYYDWLSNTVHRTR